MVDDIRRKAAEAQAEIDAMATHPLPDPAAEAAPPDADDPAMAAEIRRRAAEIDLADSATILGFGAGAQNDLQAISQAMLADVRAKDLGPAGDSLSEIVSALRGFSATELDGRRDRTLWERLTGRAAPFARVLARFETVQGQIDEISDRLLGHEHKLLKDIKALDRLYGKTLEFYRELALYIAAGAARLEELDRQTIPALEARVAEAAPDDQVLRAQELRDLRAARDDLDRRVHDLRLTRQVTMQALPSLRLVQENDKSLVSRINSTLVNTVPLWETQLAQALTIQRAREAAQAVRRATDLTNELLTANAENLREANRTVREESERGVFDIAAVARANDMLIATIEDSLTIAETGKVRRAEAEQALTKLETDLRDALAAARTGRGRAG
ncbi:MAG: toxic anion resistance protein [Alkalilacustris sp.]